MAHWIQTDADELINLDVFDSISVWENDCSVTVVGYRGKENPDVGWEEDPAAQVLASYVIINGDAASANAGATRFFERCKFLLLN